MKTIAKLAACALVLAVVCGGSLVTASEEISQQQGKMKCTACHDKAGSKLLTDQGKYYEAMGTLDGYDNLSSTFGRCTTCHVTKPGSAKLTKRGKQLAEVVTNMDELREWLSEQHPLLGKPSEKAPAGKD